MRRLKIRPLLFGSTALASALVFGIAFWFANYHLSQSLDLDFNVGLYNYAVDLSEAVQLQPKSDLAIPFESYLDKTRVFPFQHGESLVEIYNRAGEVKFRYTLNNLAPPPTADFLKLRKDHYDEFYYDSKSNDVDWRTLILALDSAKPATLFLKVTVPLDFLEAQRQNYADKLLIAAVLGVLLLSILLAMVSRLLTRPLERLSSQVQFYQPGAESKPIDIPKGPVEFRSLGEQFNSLLERVSRLLRAEKEFAANAAHQLKTPLTIARGHMEMLQKELTGDQAEAAKVSLSEIDHLAQVINNLLTLSNIESGLSQPRLEPINIGELILQAIERLKPLVDSRGRRFRLKMDDMDRLTTTTDSQFFLEAIRNLLENAVKYASNDVIDVSVSVEGDEIRVSISNEVSQEPRSRIETGHGLGLAIAKRLFILINIEMDQTSDPRQYAVRLRIKKN